MKTVSRRILAALIIVAVIATVGLLAEQYTSLEWLIAREAELRAAVSARPLTAWLCGLAIYVGLSLIPGTSGKAVIFGWLFGFWSALLMVDLALTSAALLTFAVSRFLLREFVEARYGGHLLHIRRKLEADAGFYLLSLRLLHAPFSFVNYTTGATNLVPLRTFWWTTQLGLLPGSAVFVFAGTRIPRLEEIATGGVWRLLDPPLLLALILTSAFPLLLKGLMVVIRRWQNGGVARAQ